MVKMAHFVLRVFYHLYKGKQPGETIRNKGLHS